MKNLMRHIRQSLSLKLGFSILLMTIPIFVAVLGILFVQSRQRIKKEAIERVTSVLNATTERVNGIMGTVETATNSNYWLAIENLHPDSLMTYSRRIVSINGNVNGSSITIEPNIIPEYDSYFSAYTFRSGDSIITESRSDSVLDKDWYRRPCELGIACWVDPFDSNEKDALSAPEAITSYCRPLYNDEGQFIGVASTDLALSELSDIIQTEIPYPNAYFVMLGHEGNYFVHPDSTRLIEQTIFTEADANHQQDVIALGHLMTTGQQGAMTVDINGRNCLVCYRPINNTDWSLALVCPESDILSDYNQLNLIILPLIIGGLLFILLLSRRVVTHAISPLSRLLKLSKFIAEGNYDEQIPTSKRHDVIGRLQNSFAIMQQSLRQHVGEIRQANEESARRNEELRLASIQAEEAIRQKNTFIQNMTHQIRTPLNIIMGFAQVLSASIELPQDEMKNISGIMKHNAMSLKRMVQMLYDSSETGLSEELSSTNSEEVSCNEIARECIDYTAEHYPDMPITFETELDDTLTIHTNRLYLMRSLRELLYNAAKYSDGQHIRLHLSKTGTFVRFITEDTGPGIAQEYLDQLFVPFSKADDLSEGLGLGLPLTKRHVTNLGGTITLDTNYHEGCRFIIEMPISA